MASSEVLDLRDYVHVLSRRRNWIVLTPLVVASVMLAQALVQTSTYESIAKVLVLPAVIPGIEVAPTQIISMPTELEVATSETVAATAERELTSKGITPGEVKVTYPVDTQTLEFAAYAPDREAAQATAQAYADAYRVTRSRNVLFSVNARLESVRNLISQTEDELQGVKQEIREAEDAGTETAALEAQETSLISKLLTLQDEESALELASNTQVSQTLDSATYPIEPYSPKPIRSLLLGLVVGLLLGVVLAFVRDRLDQRVNSREDAEAAAQAPVLGLVPKAPSLHRLIAVAQGGDASAAEAFRSLRTRILFAASKDGLRTIMVTSAVSGEGKTTTAVNLAVALAQADTRVVLVSGDMHHPAIWRYVPERGLSGLADVLAGSAPLSEVLVHTAYDNLSFVPSGRLEIVPEAALGSSEMLQTLRDLSDRADLVVIDAPPTLGVADALDLASLVDGVILTVDATRARKDLVGDCVKELRSIGATIVGMVLTRVDPGQLTQHGYGFGYGRREPAKRTDAGPPPSDELPPPDFEERVEVERTTAHDTGTDAVRERFGGMHMHIRAQLVGMLMALALTLVLAGITGAIVGGVAFETGVDEQLNATRTEVSIGSVTGGLVVLAIAFLVGGWAAGRMSRYDGGRNGLMTGVWFLALCAILGGLGAWVGAEYNVAERVDLLPDWFGTWFAGDDIATGAIVRAIALVIVVILLAGLIGGKLGERLHGEPTR